MTTDLVPSAALASKPDGTMLVTTLEEVPGYTVNRVVGLVRGSTIRSRHVGNDIMAAFKTLVGGEITEYTKMLGQAREQALDRMRAEALARGANAVIGMRFSTAAVMQGAAEVLAYGTAVTLTPTD